MALATSVTPWPKACLSFSMANFLAPTFFMTKATPALPWTLSLATGRRRFFQPCWVIFGLEDRVSMGRLVLVMIGAPAIVVPEQKWPMKATFFGSSAIFVATVPACLGSQASSSGATVSFRPSTPPLAFHSSNASLMPFR